MSDQTTAPATPRSSRAGKPIVKRSRWDICDYFISANYAPFTARHVREITRARSVSNAQMLIDNLLAINWARRTSPPDCKLPEADKNALWYELTALGVKNILQSTHANNNPLPIRYTRRPLYLSPGVFSPKPQTAAEDPKTPVVTGALAVAPRKEPVEDRAPAISQLVISTPSGDVALNSDALRPVYKALKAIFG